MQKGGRNALSRLFIYYSQSGNGDLVAETLSAKGYDIRKVLPLKKPPKAFFLQILTQFKFLVSSTCNLYEA